MSKNIAIFRQAKISQVSTLNHLLQELSKDNLVNHETTQKNIVLFHENEKTFARVDFDRDGSNKKVAEIMKKRLINTQETIIKNIKKRKKIKFLLNVKKMAQNRQKFAQYYKPKT